MIVRFNSTFVNSRNAGNFVEREKRKRREERRIGNVMLQAQLRYSLFYSGFQRFTANTDDGSFYFFYTFYILFFSLLNFKNWDGK